MRAALTLMSSCAGADVEVCVLLSGNAQVRALNRQWRQTDAATNVLAFPAMASAAQPDKRLGDVIVACETVMAEARAQRKRPRDHLSHLIVHGVLHLLGHDHQTNADADRMERLERRILARLGIADPYRTCNPAGI
jgi:probable rRNA maturation factor